MDHFRWKHKRRCQTTTLKDVVDERLSLWCQYHRKITEIEESFYWHYVWDVFHWLYEWIGYISNRSFIPMYILFAWLYIDFDCILSLSGYLHVWPRFSQSILIQNMFSVLHRPRQQRHSSWHPWETMPEGTTLFILFFLYHCNGCRWFLPLFRYMGYYVLMKGIGLIKGCSFLE